MRLRRWLSLLVVAVSLGPVMIPLTGTPPARSLAQDGCIAEREPNDTEDVATPIVAELCASGELPDEDQDLWLWQLTSDDARAPWSFSVDGVPGTATSLRVFTVVSEPGASPPVAGDQLFDVTTQPNAPAASVAEVLLPAGDYLLGISRSGTAGGEPPPEIGYGFRIERGRSLPDQRESEPNDDVASANPLSAEFAVAGDNSGSMDTYRWTLSAADAEQGWQIESNSLVTSPITLELRDAAGRSLATYSSDQLGRLTVRDLALSAGDYQLDVWSGGDEASPYVLRSQSQPAPEHDREPNDRLDLAVPLPPGDPVAKGRIDHQGDVDWFRLTIDATLATSQFDLKLIWRSGLN
ncbi:MAG: hypothetical protein IT336_14405, partial [Thermomicrobiales bacterium]|nr:hypothetical protein [Thermomicrobiales bacterium]